jgi:hypothetical protein
LNQIVKQAP